MSGKRNDSEGPKEIPGQKNYPGMPFFIPAARLPIREERDTLFRRRAGLLASGSSYSPPFPSMLTVAIRLSSPVTAAGPQRICTVFPLVPEGTTHPLQTAPTLGRYPSSLWLFKSIEKFRVENIHLVERAFAAPPVPLPLNRCPTDMVAAACSLA
jgi:hypothetical protein